MNPIKFWKGDQCRLSSVPREQSLHINIHIYIQIYLIIRLPALRLTQSKYVHCKVVQTEVNDDMLGQKIRHMIG